MSEFRLADRKYAEAEYFFQTIEMAKSDEEYDADLRSCSPSAMEILEKQAPSPFSWKFKHRQRMQRRYTVSHAAPPAPPSTPTSLTAASTPTPSPTGEAENHFLIDYPNLPIYKRNLKEKQLTEAELADLFNVFTITGSGNDSKSTIKIRPERGISAASRVIRKHDASAKVFKVRRNPKEFFREPDEDSVSAPEYEVCDEELYKRRRSRRRFRARRFARFEHQERMDAIVDRFDTSMSINDA